MGALNDFDEFENALIGAVEAAGEAVGVGVVLAEAFQLADVDLADERRNILVVVVAWLGLGDRDLLAPRGKELHDPEALDIAAEFLEPLERPWAGRCR